MDLASEATNQSHKLQRLTDALHAHDLMRCSYLATLALLVPEVRATIAAGQHLPQILDVGRSETRLCDRKLMHYLRDRCARPDASTEMHRM